VDGIGSKNNKNGGSKLEPTHEVVKGEGFTVLRLLSGDGTNKLTRERVVVLTKEIERLAAEVEVMVARGEKPLALVITGNKKFFSAGADLNEIRGLNGDEALEFAQMGQRLMMAIDHFPVQVIAHIEGYCMGGGLDLALACDVRVAGPNVMFGHRGAALGIMTGWGGTQRLPRLIGKAQAMQMLVTAEMMNAERAAEIGLVDKVVSGFQFPVSS